MMNGFLKKNEIKKRPANKLKIQFLGVALTILTTSCFNAKTEKPVDSSEDQEIKSSLQNRLEQTQRIKQKLKKIEENLKPIDSSLRDLSKLLKSKSTEAEQELKNLGISELRETLKQLSTQLGIDFENSDENAHQYSLTRKIKLPVSVSTRAGEISCETMTLKLNFLEKGDSKNSLNNDFVSELFLQPCGSSEFIQIALIEVSKEDSIQMKFTSQSLRSLPESQMSIDKCTLRIEAKTNEAELNCDAFNAKAFDAELAFDPIHFLRTNDGIEMNLFVNAFKQDSGAALGSLSITQQFGDKAPTTRIKTASEN